MFGPLCLLQCRQLQAKILEDSGTAVLLGDDMVRLKWQRIVGPRYSTVFAAIARHLPNLFQQQPIHAFPLDRMCPAAFSD